MNMSAHCLTLETFDEPRFPQRTIAVEWLGHDPSHQAAERSVIARCGQRCVSQVVREVEMGIIDPDRSAQLERHRTHSLAVAGDEVQLGGDHPRDVVEGRRRVGKHAHPADVHVADPVLQVEELGVERIHPLHRSPPPSMG